MLRPPTRSHQLSIRAGDDLHARGYGRRASWRVLDRADYVGGLALPQSWDVEGASRSDVGGAERGGFRGRLRGRLHVTSVRHTVRYGLLITGIAPSRPAPILLAHEIPGRSVETFGTTRSDE